MVPLSFSLAGSDDGDIGVVDEAHEAGVRVVGLLSNTCAQIGVVVIIVASRLL